MMINLKVPIAFIQVTGRMTRRSLTFDKLLGVDLTKRRIRRRHLRFCMSSEAISSLNPFRHSRSMTHLREHAKIRSDCHRLHSCMGRWYHRGTALRLLSVCLSACLLFLLGPLSDSITLLTLKRPHCEIDSKSILLAHIIQYRCRLKMPCLSNVNIDCLPGTSC